MKKLLLTTSAVVGFGLFASGASAMTMEDGFNYWIDNGDDTITVIFDRIEGSDTIPNDVEADKITFMDNVVAPGLTIEATAMDSLGGTREVIQDEPSNGGLGVNGIPAGDNMGLGEILTLTFSQAVDIVTFTLNGLLSGDGHQDAADGSIVVGDGVNSSGSLNAADYDGIGDPISSLCAIAGPFCGVTTLTFAPNQDFEGYLESVTFRTLPDTTPQIPLPAGLPLLLAGLGAFGVMKRRKKA